MVGQEKITQIPDGEIKFAGKTKKATNIFKSEKTQRLLAFTLHPTGEPPVPVALVWNGVAIRDVTGSVGTIAAATGIGAGLGSVFGPIGTGIGALLGLGVGWGTTLVVQRADGYYIPGTDTPIHRELLFSNCREHYQRVDNQQPLTPPSPTLAPHAHQVELVVGTPEWDGLTERRAALIEKLYSPGQGLTAEEQTEYERLQQLSRAAIDQACPRPRLPPEELAIVKQALGIKDDGDGS